MSKDAAAEATETEGWRPNEGKGRGGSKRAHTTEQYVYLRSGLGVLNLVENLETRYQKVLYITTGSGGSW